MMRSLALTFMLVMLLGCAQSYPLNGGSEAVNCTLFGITKVPVPGLDPNATAQEYILKVDMGLPGDGNATFELVDSKDNVYKPDKSLTRSLQPGRQLLGFVVPKDALFKLFKVSPSSGKPFAVKWWRTPKVIQRDLIIRYYGIVDYRIDPNEQSVAFEVGIQNNGTSRVPISPENFTVIDQWGWPYFAVEGFSPSYLEAKKSTKVKINFSPLSPLSRPSALIYDYMTANQIAIDLEKDTGPLSDAQAYGTGNSQAAPSATPTAVQPLPAELTIPAVEPLQLNNPTETAALKVDNATGANKKVLSLKDQINATRERLGKMSKPGPSSSSQSIIGGQISSSVEEARARLAKMKEGLKSNQSSAIA